MRRLVQQARAEAKRSTQVTLEPAITAVWQKLGECELAEQEFMSISGHVSPAATRHTSSAVMKFIRERKRDESGNGGSGPSGNETREAPEMPGSGGCGGSLARMGLCEKTQITGNFCYLRGFNPLLVAVFVRDYSRLCCFGTEK